MVWKDHLGEETLDLMTGRRRWGRATGRACGKGRVQHAACTRRANVAATKSSWGTRAWEGGVGGGEVES